VAHPFLIVSSVIIAMILFANDKYSRRNAPGVPHPCPPGKGGAVALRVWFPCQKQVARTAGLAVRVSSLATIPTAWAFRLVAHIVVRCLRSARSHKTIRRNLDTSRIINPDNTLQK
jgi:hypothetical protein